MSGLTSVHNGSVVVITVVWVWHDRHDAGGISRDDIAFLDSHGQFAAIDVDCGSGGAGVGAGWHNETLRVCEGDLWSCGRREVCMVEWMIECLEIEELRRHLYILRWPSITGNESASVSAMKGARKEVSQQSVLCCAEGLWVAALCQYADRSFL